MKDLGNTNFCLGCNLSIWRDEIFVYQSTYIGNFFKRLYMDKAHPLNIPMQVRLLDVKQYIFQPRVDNEELLDL